MELTLNLTPWLRAPVWTALPPWGPTAARPCLSQRAAFQALFCAPTTEVLTPTIPDIILAQDVQRAYTRCPLHPPPPLKACGSAETPLSSSCSLWPLAPPQHAWPRRACL